MRAADFFDEGKIIMFLHVVNSLNTLHGQFVSHWAASTHQLQRREVSFPPQVLLHVRADRSQTVVRVHDYVHKGVDQADEECWSV